MLATLLEVQRDAAATRNRHERGRRLGSGRARGRGGDRRPSAAAGRRRWPAGGRVLGRRGPARLRGGDRGRRRLRGPGRRRRAADGRAGRPPGSGRGTRSPRLADAAAPLERRIAADLDAAGAARVVARRGVGAAVGTEAGLAAGYAAKRVLGQYDVALFGRPRPARLLFVARTWTRARRNLDADRELFLRWVALHETTHVIQFERVEWLAPAPARARRGADRPARRPGSTRPASRRSAGG